MPDEESIWCSKNIEVVFSANQQLIIDELNLDTMRT